MTPTTRKQRAATADRYIQALIERQEALREMVDKAALATVPLAVRLVASEAKSSRAARLRLLGSTAIYPST
jgi:hypothetical protein